MDGGRRLSVGLASSDEQIKPAWAAFLDAAEVCRPTHSAHAVPRPSGPIWRSHPSRPGPSRSRPVPQVLDAVSTYNALRLACGVPDDAFGRPAFDKVLQATLVSQVPVSQSVSHYQTPTSGAYGPHIHAWSLVSALWSRRCRTGPSL